MRTADGLPEAAGFPARTPTTCGISVADIRRRLGSGIQAPKFRREYRAHPYQFVPRDSHHHRFFSRELSGARSGNRPYPEHDPHACGHSIAAHRPGGEFRLDAASISRAPDDRRGNHHGLERRSHSDHCFAPRRLDLVPLADAHGDICVLHERLDFLSCSGREHRCDAGVSRRRHGVGIAGTRVRL